MFRISIFSILGAAVTACNPVQSTVADQEYTITKMGMQQIEDRNEYSYSNNVSFTAVQEYKFKNESGFKEPHFLVLKVTKRSGDTVLSDTAQTWIYVENGEATEQCRYYFSITEREEGALESLTCDFELQGILLFAAKAKLYQSEPKTPPKPTTES